MLKYLPGGKNLLADALSQMPQYKSTREEVVNSIISKHLSAKISESSSPLGTSPVSDEKLTHQLKEALQKDE